MKNEPKMLPPSLREKKRYIVFKIFSERKLNYTEFNQVIWKSILDFLGELKASELNLWVIKNLFDEENQKGIIRCSHNSIEEIRAALSLVSYIEDTRVTISIKAVTGTIKSAKTKYLPVKNLKDFE